MSAIDRAKSAISAAIETWRAAPPSGHGIQVLSAEVPTEDRTPAELIAGTPPNIDRYPRILGSNMTPASLSAAQRYALIGYMQPLADLLSEQRSKVTHMQAVMNVRSASVAGKPWLIIPPDVNGARKKKQAIEIANYVRRRLKAASGTLDGAISFKDGLKCLADGGPYFGRAALETQFFRDAEGVGVAGFRMVHARRLSYAGGWKLRIYDQSGNERMPELGQFPGVDPRERFPGRFILHEPKTSGAEYQTRQGVGHSLLWTSLFWNWTARDWMKYLELHGKPWRVGHFTKENASADINKLKDIVRAMSGGAAVAMPAGTDLKLLTPANAADAHAKLRTAMNAEISKVVLGQTGTTELGDVGSYAATKTMDLVRGDITQDDGCSLSESITRDLVRVLVALQYGDAAAAELCPNFLLQTQPQESLDAEYKRVESMGTKLGIAFGADEMRARFSGLSKPEKGEELAKPPAPSAKPPTATETDPADARGAKSAA